MIFSRPKKLKDILGHKKYLNSTGLITRMIAKNSLHSLIFYGPPGIGKTTLAFVIANEMNYQIVKFDPTKDKKSYILNKIKVNKENNKFILLIDEIHRLNRDKQDVLLSLIEFDKIIIFATTTENPFFVINPALRSRMHLLVLEKINQEELLVDIKKILKNKKVYLESKHLEKIIHYSNGDIRFCLNKINLLFELYENSDEISDETLEYILPFINSNISKFGDNLHDLKSAFHKSIRGSDPNAAIYYLAQLLISDDLKSISRRILASAYEDIGLANPNLVGRVLSAVETANMLGMPEAKQVLATIVIEMCLSPKSNSAYLAISQALSDIGQGKIYNPPNHIREQSYKSAKKLGIQGYKYPHDFHNSFVEQQYMPNEIKNKKYYNPNLDSKNENLMNKIHEEKKQNNKFKK